MRIPIVLMLLGGATVALGQANAPDTTFTAEDITVTASRYDDKATLNVSNVTAEDLRLREPDLELPLLLQGLPGVFSYSDAGSGLGYTYLKIRGFDQRRVGVLFNGIPFNDPEDHQVWWVDLPDLAASVQDIQVQRGVTNSIGGMTAIGGTVNIVSAGLTDRPQGRISVNGGSYGFTRQMISYQTGNLAGSDLKSSFRLSRQASDGYRERSGHEGWAVFWSAEHETDRTSTQVNVYTGRELTHHAWDAVPESVLRENRRANLETYHNAVDDFRQPHYELHNTVWLGDDLSLVNRLYYIQGEGFYENYKEDEDAVLYSLDTLDGVADTTSLDLIRRKWVRKDHVGWVPHLAWQQDKGRLLVGGDWYTFHSNHWGEVLWAEGFTPGDFTSGFKYHEYTGDKDAVSLYASERYEVAVNLTVTADLHYQHKRYRFAQNEVKNFTGDLLNRYEVTYDFFNPKGALNWQVPGRVVSGELQAFAAAGINHREPTDNELFDTWSGGSDLGAQPLFRTSRPVYAADGATVAYVEWSDPLVKEERVVDYELGLAWRSPRLSITLGGYWMDFTNEIVPYGGVNDDGSSIRGNAGKTLHRGVELGLRARVSNRHGLTLAASRSWDEFEEFLFHDWDGQVYDYAGNPIALFPQHLVMASWDADWWRGLTTRVRVRNTGRQHLDNSGLGERTIDPWTTLDLSLWIDLGAAGWDALRGAQAFLHLRNLGDTEYETWGYWYGENYLTPAAGRNFVCGLDYDF
jgi:iron complex outermembrane receptor protein